MSFSFTNFIIGTIISIFGYQALKNKNYLVAGVLFIAYIIICYAL